MVFAQHSSTPYRQFAVKFFLQQSVFDIEKAAAEGNEQAQLAIDVFVESIRTYVGTYLAALNGADAICFTGGIGQHSSLIRNAVLENLDFAGIVLDAGLNDTADGNAESRIKNPHARLKCDRVKKRTKG